MERYADAQDAEASQPYSGDHARVSHTLKSVLGCALLSMPLLQVKAPKQMVRKVLVRAQGKQVKPPWMTMTQSKHSSASGGHAARKQERQRRRETRTPMDPRKWIRWTDTGIRDSAFRI